MILFCVFRVGFSNFGTKTLSCRSMFPELLFLYVNIFKSQRNTLAQSDDVKEKHLSTLKMSFFSYMRSSELRGHLVLYSDVEPSSMGCSDGYKSMLVSCNYDCGCSEALTHLMV